MLRDVVNNEIGTKQGCLLALTITFLFCFPLMYADVYYVDDVVRSQTGYLGWSKLGRPLSDMVIQVFSFGGKGIDVSPLPLMLSALLMAHAIVVISKGLITTISRSSIVVASVAIATPLYLHNLAYRYDSLSMTLAVLCAVYAWKISLNGGVKNYFIASVMLLASLCLYQPCAIIMASLVIFSSCIRFINGVEILKYISRSVSVFASGFLAYYALIFLSAISATRSDLIFSSESWLELLMRTSGKYISLFWMAYPSLLNYLIALMLAASLLILVVNGFYRARVERKMLSVSTASVVCIASVPVALILSFITMSFLKEGLVMPRMAPSYGFFVMGLISIVYMSGVKYTKEIASASAAVILFSSIVLSFAFGSSLAAQKHEDQFVLSSIINTIQSHPSMVKNETTTFGEANESSVSAVNSRTFPLIGKINARLYDWTASLYLERYGVEKVKFSFNRASNSAIAKQICSQGASPVIANSNYSIYVINNINFVWLGKSCI